MIYSVDSKTVVELKNLKENDIIKFKDDAGRRYDIKLKIDNKAMGDRIFKAYTYNDSFSSVFNFENAVEHLIAKF